MAIVSAKFFLSLENLELKTDFKNSWLSLLWVVIIDVYKIFKKNQDNSDIFKKLIHRLSDMSVQDLEKIDWLLDIIFTPYQEWKQLKIEVVFRY